MKDDNSPFSVAIARVVYENTPSPRCWDESNAYQWFNAALDEIEKLKALETKNEELERSLRLVKAENDKMHGVIQRIVEIIRE